MDDGPAQRAHLADMLAQYRQNLRTLELQASTYGIEVPLHIDNQIKACLLYTSDAADEL